MTQRTKDRKCLVSGDVDYTLRGLRTRRNNQEKRESVWSCSNLFLARHIFIFNAAVSDHTKHQSEESQRNGEKGKEPTDGWIVNDDQHVSVSRQFIQHSGEL